MKLIDATQNDLILINRLMRRSKAYWGYDADFMNKFMSIFQITNDYIDKNCVKLLFENNADQFNSQFIGLYSFNPERMELDNFFIDPDYIGKGYGKKLWCYLLDHFRTLDVRDFTLWSDPGAEAFYKKMGCEKIGVKKSPMMPNRYPVIFKYQL